MSCFTTLPQPWVCRLHCSTHATGAPICSGESGSVEPLLHGPAGLYLGERACRQDSQGPGGPMRGLIRRLARTGARELLDRGTEALWIASEALEFRRQRGHHGRSRLRLVPLSPELRWARRALAREDWGAASAALRTHFLQREGRFTIDPGSREAFSTAARTLFPSSREEAARRGDSLLDGRYDLLGYDKLSFQTGADRVDWHLDPVHGRRSPLRFWARVPYLSPRCGDHKIIWELNRHQHWLALGRAAWSTGDARYAAGFRDELTSWLRANPPLAGTNWASMLELAFRSISWIWALHLFVSFDDDPASTWPLDLLAGLERQLDHVSRHLSTYFSPNTHLLGEGLALYVGGRVLPELTSAARWERIGRGILLSETRAQVNADGGHAELSLHYHRYALDFYLLALTVARRTGDPAAEPFSDVVSRLASYCRALADDRGWLARIGDDDGGMLFPMCGRAVADASDSLSLAAALLGRPELAVGEPPEEALWMLGGNAAALMPYRPTEVLSQTFPQSGYTVIRSSREHAVLDAGPHGFLNGGHAHADALSLVLSVYDRPFLIDPGTATYTMDPEKRDHFRSTRMHNTAVLDGRSQSEMAGPFHWSTKAHGRVIRWRPAARDASQHDGGMRDRSQWPDSWPGARIDYVEAEHDGYMPRIHRRAVLRIGEGLWIVADHMLGTGPVHADTYWHLDPAWSTDEGGPGFRHSDGLHAAIVSTAPDRQEFRGDHDGLGSCAPVYGGIVPSSTLRMSEAGHAPLTMVTALAASPGHVRLTLERLAITSSHEDGWHRAAVLVTFGDIRVVTVFATPGTGAVRPDPAPSPQRVSLPGSQFTTAARAAVLRISPSGEPVSLDVIDGTDARWQGTGAFSLASADAAADLHLDTAALQQLGRQEYPVG